MPGHLQVRKRFVMKAWLVTLVMCRVTTDVRHDAAHNENGNFDLPRGRRPDARRKHTNLSSGSLFNNPPTKVN